LIERCNVLTQRRSLLPLLLLLQPIDNQAAATGVTATRLGSAEGRPWHG